MSDAILENEQFQYQILLSICSGLGHFAEEPLSSTKPSTSPLDRPYHLGTESIECLRDLKRLLRHNFNSSEKSIHERLGAWNIVRNHLLPMFLQFGAGKMIKVPIAKPPFTPLLPAACEPDAQVDSATETPEPLSSSHVFEASGGQTEPAPTRLVYIMTGRNKTIAKLILELLVAMTWPFEAEAQPDASSSASPLQDCVLAYKEALADPLFMQGFMDVLMHALSQNSRKQETQEYAQTIVQLCIFLLRNLLAIPDVEFQGKSIQTQLIAALHQTRVVELLNSMCSEMMDGRYTQWCLQLLEVYMALWFARDPLELVASMDTSQARMRAELSTLLKSDKHAQGSSHRTAYRHPKFGGVYAITLSTGKDYIVHNSSKILRDIDTDDKKRPKYWKKPLCTDLDIKKPTELHLARILFPMAREFLESSFNGLISAVAAEINSTRAIVNEQDHVRFLWIARFFFKFFLSLPTQTRADIGFDVVYSLLNTEFVKYLGNRISTYLADKLWKELHGAVECFKEFLYLLESLSYSPSKLHQTTSQHIQSNIYYDHERLQTLVHLTRTYTSQSRGYLRTLVELNHILLRCLERFSRQTGSISVLKKKKKKQANPDVESQFEDELAPEQQTETYEAEMQFEKFESQYLCESVIGSYALLLESYATNDAMINHFVIRMYHRIAIKCGQTLMFYKMALLSLMNDILSMPPALQPQQKEIVTFAKHLVYSFFKKMSEYPLLLLEVFYPKGNRDVNRIRGYSAIGESNSTALTEIHEAEAVALKASVQRDSQRILEQLHTAVHLDDIQRKKLLVASIARHEKSHQVHWLCTIIESVLGNRQAESFLGVNFEESVTEGLIGPAEYPEVKGYFVDGIFCQLLGELGWMEKASSSGHSSDRCWALIPGCSSESLIEQKTRLLQLLQECELEKIEAHKAISNEAESEKLTFQISLSEAKRTKRASQKAAKRLRGPIRSSEKPDEEYISKSTGQNKEDYGSDDLQESAIHNRSPLVKLRARRMLKTQSKRGAFGSPALGMGQENTPQLYETAANSQIGSSTFLSTKDFFMPDEEDVLLHLPVHNDDRDRPALKRVYSRSKASRRIEEDEEDEMGNQKEEWHAREEPQGIASSFLDSVIAFEDG